MRIAILLMLAFTYARTTGQLRASLQPFINQRSSRPSRVPLRPTNRFTPITRNRTTRQRITRQRTTREWMSPPGQNQKAPAQPDSQSTIILTNISNLVLGYIVAVLNMIEILLLKKLPRKLKIYELLIFSMSISDFSFGFSSSTLLILYFAHPPWRQWTSLTSLWYTMYFFFIVSSILHLLTIAADRLFAVIKPVQHNVFISRKRIIRIILTLWAISFIISASLYISNAFSHAFKKQEIEYEAQNITESNLTITSSNNTILKTQSTKATLQSEFPDIVNSTDYTRETFVQSFVNQKTNLSNSVKLTQQTQTSASSIQHRERNHLVNLRRKLNNRAQFQSSNLSTNRLPTRTTKLKPPQVASRPKIKNIRYVDVFEQKMKEWLSFILIFADVTLVTIYSVLIFAIIQHHRNNKNLKASKDGNLKRVLMICILIATAFVIFTLPYAILNLSLTKRPLWASLFLVTNSGVNSLVFFVRGEYR